MEDKINRIFDKLENADVSPSANYSMPEYYNIEVETDNDSIFAYDDSGYGITVKFEYTMF